MMKKHIPNLLSSTNLLIGVYGCYAVIQNPSMAIYFVLASAVFDFLDGLSAKLLKAQSEFGMQLDSLADMVSFGTVPALAIFSYISSPMENPSFMTMIPLLIVPFSALRLARFNLTSASDEFQGLPTPANAILISAFLITPFDFVKAPFLVGLSIISCILLVSNFRMIALKFPNLKFKGNELRYLLLLLIITGLILWGWAITPFVIPTYIAVSLVGYYLLKPVLS